jgi:phosphoglycolate phosphatase-like HAD superfamily hydrolase
VELFSDFTGNEINEFLEWAVPNGGISRYDKIRYFYNNIRHEEISDENVNFLAGRYSDIVKQNVINAPDVKGARDFLKDYHTRAEFHLLSASDGEELREVCKARKIDGFFKTISGSPVNKKDNLRRLIENNGWLRSECLYIGDSVNDLDAAILAGIDFIGRNSGLENWSKFNIYNFDNYSQNEFANYFEQQIK